jgi:transcriptional regulator with XRE-family HTH domain
MPVQKVVATGGQRSTAEPALAPQAGRLEEAGQRLRRVREHLGLRYRDVEDASGRIADRHKSSEYSIALSRLADIENKGTLPTLFRLYSLCAIYRLELSDVLRWYGIDLGDLPADALEADVERTHLLEFGPPEEAQVLVPLTLDPGIDLSRTTYLSRVVQKWGRLPLALLRKLELKNHRYGLIGTEDRFMYPLLQPGALVLVDEARRKIVAGGWSNEFERPIYFFELREGYACGWCNLSDNRLVLQPHPASLCQPVIYLYPSEIDVVGQVVGVAMRLAQGRRRRTGS